MGNNTSKKNEVKQTKETTIEEDACCQSYSRLQESERAEAQSQTEVDPPLGEKSSNKILANQTSNAHGKSKTAKGSEKKKKEKPKKEKKKNCVLVNVTIDSENENESVSKESVATKPVGGEILEDDTKCSEQSNDSCESGVRTNLDTGETEIEKSNLISKECVAEDSIQCDKDEDITMHIIENVENESRELHKATIDTENKDCANDTVEKDADTSTKQDMNENVSNTKKGKSKSSKSKKGSKQLDDNSVDASDKDTSSEKITKKKKSKKDKVDESKSSKIDKSTESKKSKKEKKLKSKSSKKDENGTVEEHEGATAIDEKTSESKSSKKNKNKKDKIKNKDTLIVSEETALTLAEEVPLPHDKDENMQPNNIGVVSTESEASVDTAELPAETDRALTEKTENDIRNENYGDEANSFVIIENDEVHTKVDHLSTTDESNPQQESQEEISKITVDEGLEDEKPLTEEHVSDKTEKAKNVKARKDSANQKKKVKSQKKVQKENGKNHDSPVSTETDIEKTQGKKFSKKESKKKDDDAAGNKKLSKKEKKTNKKVKKPKEENKRLLESESSIGCLSKNSTSSLERTRPSLIFDDFVPPEQLNVDAISLSSVSMDGTDEVFPASNSTYAEKHDSPPNVVNDEGRSEEQVQEIPVVSDTSAINVGIVRL